MINNVFADSISRLQFGIKNYFIFVFVLFNKEVLSFLNLLRNEGLIFGYSFKTNYLVCVYLKYFLNRSVINHIYFFNPKKQCLVFSFKSILSRVSSLYSGFLIFNTSKGLLTIKQLFFFRIGGRLVAQIF